MKPRGSKSKLFQTCARVLTKTAGSRPQRKPRHRHREAVTSQALQHRKGNSVKKADTILHTKSPTRTEPAAIIVRRGGKTQSYFRPLSETIHRRPHGDSAVPWCVEACDNIALESHVIVVGVPEGVVELPTLDCKTRTSEVTVTECDEQSAADDTDEIDESRKHIEKLTDAVVASENDGASVSSPTSLEALARIVQELSKVAEDLRLCRLSAEHLDHDTTQPGNRNSKPLPRTRKRSQRTQICMSTRDTAPKHLDECSVEKLRDQEVSPRSFKSAAPLTFDLSPKHVGVTAARGALLLEEEQMYLSTLPADDSSSEKLPLSCSDDSDVVDIDIDEYFATLPRDVLHEDYSTPENTPRPRGSHAPARSEYARRHASTTSWRPSPRLVSPGPGMKPNPCHGSRQPRNCDKCQSSHDCEPVCVCPVACTRRSSAKASRNSAGHQEQLSGIRRMDEKATGVEVTQHGGVGQKRPERAHHPVQYDPAIEKSRTFNHQRGNAFTKVSRWLMPLTRGLRTLQVHYAHANAEHNDRLIFAHLLRAAHVRNAAVEEGVYITERRLYARRHDNTPHATTFYNTDDVIHRALKRGSRAAADRHNTKP